MKNTKKIKGDKKLVVFSAETENLIENAKEKLIKKGADLVVANDVTKQGAGFETDTNDVVVIDKNPKVIEELVNLYDVGGICEGGRQCYL